MYPKEMVLPMKAELTDNGFKNLDDTSAVDEAMRATGTTLLMVNSVCGCAAGSARPGVVMAVKNATKKPDNLTTVFAGVDTEAVQHARTYMLPYPPSSPAIALFKDGELVHMIERHMIEGRPAQMIASNLQSAFDQYCD